MRHSGNEVGLKLHVQFLRDLMKTKPVQRPERCQNTRHARYPEPGGLIVRRGDGKIEGCTNLVPHTTVVACGDVEVVASWRKIGIKRLAATARILPVAIVPLQLVAKTDLLRRDEADSGIVDFEITNQRRQAQVR